MSTPADDDDSPTPRPQRSGRRRRVVIALLVAGLLVVAVLAAASAAGLRTYRVPSGSMLPTIPCGSHIVATRLPRALQGVHRGEVWVLTPPAGRGSDGEVDRGTIRGEDDTALFAIDPHTPRRSDLVPARQTYVKRIVAVGGDTIRVDDGQAIVNGTPQHEPFRHGEAERLSSHNRLMQMATYHVPRGWVFAMGDWRGNSSDSRFWGPVPTSFLVAEVRGISWPLHAAGPLRHDGSADRGTDTRDETGCVDVTSGK